MGRKRTEVAPRFWSKVNKDGPTMPHMTTNCWVWTGGCDWDGYGCFWLDGWTQRATRVALQLSGSPIPDNLQACHKCDNPGCVRPEHLYAGTAEQNSTDVGVRGRKRGGPGRGAAHHSAKLTEDDVRCIRLLVEAGERQKLVANRYGLDPSTVSHIIARDIWSHVP